MKKLYLLPLVLFLLSTLVYGCNINPKTPTDYISNADWEVYPGSEGTAGIWPVPDTEGKIVIYFNLQAESDSYVAIVKKTDPEKFLDYKGIRISFIGLGDDKTIEVKFLYDDNNTIYIDSDNNRHKLGSDTMFDKIFQNFSNTKGNQTSIDFNFDDLTCRVGSGLCKFVGQGELEIELTEIDRIDITISNFGVLGSPAGSGFLIIESIQLIP